MKSHTFFQPEPQRTETTILAILALVGLLAIALAILPAIVPPDNRESAAASVTSPVTTVRPYDRPLSRLDQMKADMRTLAAALRYLLEPETDAVMIA
jgi:hypothetical protein